MGADLDVCSKDQDVDRLFLEAYGPQDEGTMQFLKRTFFKFTETIKNPKRRTYDLEILSQDSYGEDLGDDYEIVEFNVHSQGKNLSSCCWRHRSLREMEEEEKRNHVCIVYVHTNTRSLADALEIFPLARKLKASVISFDLCGCGKSEGSMHMTMHKDLACIVEWAQCLIGPDVRIILWGRGLGTVPSMEFSYDLSRKGGKQPVKLLVLDSPFTSSKQVGLDILENFQGATSQVLSRGVFEMLLTMGTKINGMNVSKINPIQFAPDIDIPTCILSATNDDYIRSSHGLEMASSWSVAVQYITFTGGHFTTRGKKDVLLSLPFITKRLGIAMPAEEIMQCLAATAPLTAEATTAELNTSAACALISSPSEVEQQQTPAAAASATTRTDILISGGSTTEGQIAQKLG